MEKVNEIIRNYITDFNGNLSIEHLIKALGKKPVDILSLYPSIAINRNNNYYSIDSQLIFRVLNNNDWEEYYYSDKMVYSKNNNGRVFIVRYLGQRTRINLDEIPEKVLSGFHIAINDIEEN